MFVLITITGAAHAQRFSENNPLTEFGWLESTNDPVDHLITQPPTCLLPAKNSAEDKLAKIGAIAFRSPYLFGGLAARKKLTCHACHQNGGSNPQFFISGLSDRPGRIDVTNGVFSMVLEDNIDNPIEIPSLYGINNKRSFGTLTPLPTKRAFVRHVIETEFDGPPANERIFEGLLAYLDRFADQCPEHRAQATEATSSLIRSAKADLTHIVKAVEIAQAEWQAGNIETANFLLLTARHELGLIDERYARPALHRERARLLSLSRTLETIQALMGAPTPDPKAMRKHTKRWHRKVRNALTRLPRAEAQSYYNRETLQQLVARSAPGAQ